LVGGDYRITRLGFRFIRILICLLGVALGFLNGCSSRPGFEYQLQSEKISDLTPAPLEIQLDDGRLTFSMQFTGGGLEIIDSTGRIVIEQELTIP
jgi:hypothetical protein